VNANSFARLNRKHARSGLSIAAFCRKQGVALSTYHYWRRRGAAPADGDFVELRLGEAAPTPPATPIRLELRGATLSLPENFSVQSLRRCLEAVRDCLSC
jgi:hypothetical protein